MKSAMKSQMKRLIKHSWIYTVGNILNRIGAFLLLPLYTSYLSVGEYGTLELLYSAKVVIASFVSIGLAHTTLRFYFEYEDPSERRKIVSTNWIAVLLISVPVVFVLSLWSKETSILLFDSAIYSNLLVMLYCIMVMEVSKEVGLAYLRAKEYSLQYVLISLVQFVLQVSICIYTVSVLKLGIFGILIGNMISVFAGWAVVTYTTLRECGLQFKYERFKEMLRYSTPFLLSSVCMVIVMNADRFIIKSFGTMENVGIYSLAVKFGMLMQVLFLEPFNRSFGSFRFSIMKDDNTKEILSKIMKYLVFALLFLGLAISLFSKPILKIMAAPEYLEAYKLVPLIVLAHTIAGLSYFFQTGILYKKKTKYIFFITVVGGIISLMCNFLFIPSMGAAGAALSMIIYGLSTAALTYVISNRLYPIIYVYSAVIKMYAVAILFFLLSYVIPTGSLIALLGINQIFFISFPVVIYFMGCIKKDEFSFLGTLFEPFIQRFRKSVV